MSSPIRGSLLVVDDEVELMNALCESLSAQNFKVDGVSTPREALSILRDSEVDILLAHYLVFRPSEEG